MQTFVRVPSVHKTFSMQNVEAFENRELD